MKKYSEKKELIVLSILSGIVFAISAVLFYPPVIFVFAAIIFLVTIVRNRNLDRELKWDVVQSIFIFGTAIAVFAIAGAFLIEPVFTNFLPSWEM